MSLKEVIFLSTGINVDYGSVIKQVYLDLEISKIPMEREYGKGAQVIAEP